MIESKDLRIGNYVYDYECSKYYPIEEICTLSKDSLNQNIGVKYRNKSAWVDCDHLQPIELNEEILLKCDIKDEFYLEYDEILECYCIYLTDNFCLNSVRLLHLHTLQNLYFCLCGNELNVNL